MRSPRTTTGRCDSLPDSPRRGGLQEALAGGPGARARARCKSWVLHALRAGGAHEVSSDAGASPPEGMGSAGTISPRPTAGRLLGDGDQVAAQRSGVCSPSPLTRPSGPPVRRTAAPIPAWSTRTPPRGTSDFRPTNGPHTQFSQVPRSMPATCRPTTGMVPWWSAGRAAVPAIKAFGRG